MKKLSRTEKSDILLALAMAFEKNIAVSESRETVLSAVELAGKNFTALNAQDLEFVKTRAAFFDNLPTDTQENWREKRLEKIRGRGRAKRLDENINPSHIVECLKNEPRAVQMLILTNLPADLSRRISLYLDLNFAPDKKTDTQINADLVALVKEKFLSNYLALEDVHEPDELDGFSVDQLENFINHLGLREIAIACRGISAKETLAAFLNRFDEKDARQIALYLTELDKIRPFWVAQADALVRKSWSADLPPAKVIKKIGFKLLAAAFVLRDESKCEYAAQKLSIRDVKNWQRLVRVSKKKYTSADAENKTRLDKRRRIIERLAVKFRQAGTF